MDKKLISYVSASAFAPALRQALDLGLTGNFFIVTNDNRSASIALEAGEVVGASYRVKRGNKALKYIKRLGRFKAQFREGKPVYVSDNDPIDANILISDLTDSEIQLNPFSAFKNISGFSSAHLSTLTELLTEDFGPTAGMMVGEASEVCDNKEALLNTLADTYDSLLEKSNFMAEARMALQKVDKKNRKPKTRFDDSDTSVLSHSSVLQTSKQPKQSKRTSLLDKVSKLGEAAIEKVTQQSRELDSMLHSIPHKINFQLTAKPKNRRVNANGQMGRVISTISEEDMPITPEEKVEVNEMISAINGMFKDVPNSVADQLIEKQY